MSRNTSYRDKTSFRKSRSLSPHHGITPPPLVNGWFCVDDPPSCVSRKIKSCSTQTLKAPSSATDALARMLHLHNASQIFSNNQQPILKKKPKKSFNDLKKELDDHYEKFRLIDNNLTDVIFIENDDEKGNDSNLDVENDLKTNFPHVLETLFEELEESEPSCSLASAGVGQIAALITYSGPKVHQIEVPLSVSQGLKPKNFPSKTQKLLNIPSKGLSKKRPTESSALKSDGEIENQNGTEIVPRPLSGVFSSRSLTPTPVMMIKGSRVTPKVRPAWHVQSSPVKRRSFPPTFHARPPTEGIVSPRSEGFDSFPQAVIELSSHKANSRGIKNSFFRSGKNFNK